MVRVISLGGKGHIPGLKGSNIKHYPFKNFSFINNSWFVQMISWKRFLDCTHIHSMETIYLSLSAQVTEGTVMVYNCKIYLSNLTTSWAVMLYIHIHICNLSDDSQHRSYKFKINMKVSINFMYYMYYVLISCILLSTFVKNHCLKSHQCTLIRDARRDR